MKNRGKSISAREASYLILLAFESIQYRLNDLIAREFSSRVYPDRDKKMIVTLTHGVVKNLILLDWRLGNLYHGDWRKARNKVKVILRLASYEADFLDFIPPHATINEYVDLAKRQLEPGSGNLINGVMRNYLRQRKQLDPRKKFKYADKRLEIGYSVPAWLVRRWIKIWGANDTEQMCAAFNARPVFDLKINRSVIGKEAFEQILVENGIGFSGSSYFSDIVKVTDIQKIRNLRLFRDGYCIVQDESARLAVEMLDLQPNDRVLDTCTAPGGKLSVIRQLRSDLLPVIGMDVDEKRISAAINTCRTEGGVKCSLVVGDGRIPPFKGEFDKILVDAPCTGFGTLQKNPDIKWRRKPEDIPAFQKLQLDILKGVCELLTEDGVIVYSTCTIEPEENEGVIARFLEEQGGRFKTTGPPAFLEQFETGGGAIRTFPHRHQMDGAFAVRLMWSGFARTR